MISFNQETTIQSEARIRQYLRMAEAIRANPATPDHGKIVMSCAATTIRWVLGEREDPPNFDKWKEP